MLKDLRSRERHSILPGFKSLETFNRTAAIIAIIINLPNVNCCRSLINVQILFVFSVAIII
jgi:hypothetical protein